LKTLSVVLQKPAWAKLEITLGTLSSEINKKIIYRQFNCDSISTESC